MRAFLDTSVLVPVFYGDHPHHPASLELFASLRKGDGCCGAHSLVEVYSALTRMPGKFRVSGAQAMLFIGDLRQRLSVMALTADEYADMLERYSALEITGGAIHDALLASCALKAKAKTLYSWNLRHYERFGRDVVRFLRTP